jgi:hypothetical protein
VSFKNKVCFPAANRRGIKIILGQDWEEKFILATEARNKNRMDYRQHKKRKYTFYLFQES